MKTTVSNLRALIQEQLLEILESVNRSRRGEEVDYKDEPEGDDVQYEKVSEDADRVRRSEDGQGETPFEEGCDEDEDEDVVSESNLYTDADKDGCDDDRKEKFSAGHAEPSTEDSTMFPGPPSGMSEVKMPSLESFFLKK